MVDLRQLLAGLPARDVPALTVRDLTDDSGRVTPGTLFLARTGPRTDGRDHIPAAVSAGATAILAEAPITPAHRAAAGERPVIEVEELSRHTSEIAERFHGNPAASLRLVGVTGTNGKTTVVHLIAELLRRTGISCATIGTLGARVGGVPVATGLTTPGALELSALLAQARDAGDRVAVMETSSHALAQHRVAALRFDVGVFTNLTRDHLDDHGSMEAYAAAKATLFTSLASDALAVLNTDDAAHARMRREARCRVLGCSLGAGAAGVRVWSSSIDGLALTLSGPWGEADAEVGLIGPWNAMNTLQAFAAAHDVLSRLGTSPEAGALAEMLRGIAGPPGRMERVDRDAGPRVFVDYAHTPDALRAALSAVRAVAPPHGRVIGVFGCGGDRDRGKRPEMGRVVSDLADLAVVTSDNPRTEDPEAIIAMIVGGMGGGAERVIEADRARAIETAIDTARPADVVVIAGKGHEEYQLLPDGEGGVRRIHFDDRECARAALARRAGACA